MKNSKIKVGDLFLVCFDPNVAFSDEIQEKPSQLSAFVFHIPRLIEQNHVEETFDFLTGAKLPKKVHPHTWKKCPLKTECPAYLAIAEKLFEKHDSGVELLLFAMLLIDTEDMSYEEFEKEFAQGAEAGNEFKKKCKMCLGEAICRGWIQVRRLDNNDFK